MRRIRRRKEEQEEVVVEEEGEEELGHLSRISTASEKLVSLILPSYCGESHWILKGTFCECPLDSVAHTGSEGFSLCFSFHIIGV